MSKFLNLVESNLPKDDIDAKTDAKRTLQRMLLDKGIKAEGRVFKDIITVLLPDGRRVELEIKSVQQTSQEEAEDPSATISAITAIASLPDQGIGKQLTSSTARKLQMAKRNMAAAADVIAKKFLKASQSQ